MIKTLLISTSLSSESINFELLKIVEQHLPQKENCDLVSIRDFELPVYNIDIEKELGIPENAKKLIQLVNNANRLIFGIAEHNGSVTAAFKNVLDWLSRTGEDYRFLSKKEILLVGTSPSPYGAKNAINHARFLMECLGGEVKAQLPFPSFYTTFSDQGKNPLIQDQKLKAELLITLQSFFTEETETHLVNEPN